MRIPACLAILVLVLVAATQPAAAQGRDGAPSAFQAAKCVRYADAWREATAKQGLKGIGQAFLARHEAFLTSGCLNPPDVCPLSREELELANVLVLRGMSLKLASTFFPFRC